MSEESGPGHLNSSAHGTSPKGSDILKVRGSGDNASWLLCRAQTGVGRGSPVRRLSDPGREGWPWPTGTGVEIEEIA